MKSRKKADKNKKMSKKLKPEERKQIQKFFQLHRHDRKHSSIIQECKKVRREARNGTRKHPCAKAVKLQEC